MIKKIIVFLVKSLVVLILLAILFVVSVNYGVFGPLYDKEELKSFSNELAAEVYAHDGAMIGKFFAENRTNAEYEDFPGQLVNALVATEDARYFDHEGIDSRSLLRVLVKTILMNDKRSGGGSTITQQLAKNMYGRKNFGPLTILVNKTKEALLAHRLEKIYTKKEILTLYLNTVPFGENVYGIEAAARRFYNKEVPELSVDQAAVLIGILKANTYYNPRLHPDHALNRRNVVLTQMYKYEYLDSLEFDSLIALPLELDYANYEAEGPANYFMVQVRKEAERLLREIEGPDGEPWNINTDGLIITTTIDSRLQHYAHQAFERHLGAMQKKLDAQYRSGQSKKDLNALIATELHKMNRTASADTKSQQEVFDWTGFYTDSISVRDSLWRELTLLHAGLLAMDPYTGAVRAWIGGIDFRTHPYDQILARRQLASTFKPILYAAGLESGFEPCDYLDNDPIVLEDFNDWSPENYDHSSGGRYTLAGALAHSMNIPTVNLFFKVGFDELDYIWHKMGFNATLNNAPATALGTAEASIYEVGIAYAAFANGGYKVEPALIESITSADGQEIYRRETGKKTERIMKVKTAQLMTGMLEKAVKEGTGKALGSAYGVRIPLAGKTGTSQRYSDAWFAAFHPNLVIVTRVGASGPSIHFNSGANGSGGRLALPLVGYTLAKAQNDPYLKPTFTGRFHYPSDALDCKDFKEDNLIDALTHPFKRDKTTREKEEKKGQKQKKQPFYKRWFKK